MLNTIKYKILKLCFKIFSRYTNWYINKGYNTSNVLVSYTYDLEKIMRNNKLIRK